MCWCLVSVMCCIWQWLLLGRVQQGQLQGSQGLQEVLLCGVCQHPGSVDKLVGGYVNLQQGNQCTLVSQSLPWHQPAAWWRGALEVDSQVVAHHRIEAGCPPALLKQLINVLQLLVPLE